MSGAWSLPLFSGVQHGLYGGKDNPDLPVGQFICQSVKLPACRGFSICCVPKEELIHRDMIAGHELKKDLKAWMLPLVLNVGEIYISSLTLFLDSLRPFLAALIAAPKGLKLYFSTGLFAIFIHPVTFYCSPFFLDMSVQFP